MKNISQIILIILSAAFLSSCDGAKEAQTENQAPAEAGAKPYPLDTCVVSGKKLGSMGEPHVIVHEGQEIKFCCDACEPTFKKDPAKFLAKLNG